MIRVLFVLATLSMAGCAVGPTGTAGGGDLEVRGRIVDDTGAPRPGCCILCAPHQSEFIGWPQADYSMGVRDGEVEGAAFRVEALDAGSWAVWAEDGARRSDPVVFELPGEVEELTLVLPRDTTVRGRVLSTDGRPLAGRRVRRVESKDRVHRYDYDYRWSETTDEGRFELQVPSTETALLECGRASVRVEPVPGGVIEGVELRLEDPSPRAVLEVRVKAPPFVWLEGHRLGLGRPAKTLEEHHFEYHLPAGLHRLKSMHPDHEQELAVVLEAGEHREVLFDLVTQPPTEVHGRITGGTLPVFGHPRSPFVLDEYGVRTRVEIEGEDRYRVRLGPGTYTFLGTMLGFAVPEGVEEIEFDADLSWPRFEVVMNVVGAHGDEPIHAGPIDTEGLLESRATRFVLPGRFPGRQTLMAFQEGRIGCALVDVDGPDCEVEITLGEPASLWVEVSRPDGRRARFPRASFFAASGRQVYPHEWDICRAGGRILEPWFWPGRFTVEVFDGAFAGSVEVDLLPGRETLAQVQLEPAARLYVVVLGPDGVPLACNLRIIAPSGGRLHVPLLERMRGPPSSMGRTWWPLVPGEYRIRAFHPLHGEVERTIHLAPGDDRSLTLPITD